MKWTIIDVKDSFFQDYEGGLECRLSSLDLYVPPVQSPEEKKKSPYCPVRSELLLALNGGGRHGFEQPYTPLGMSAQAH